MGIRLRGELDCHSSSWPEGLEVHHIAHAETLLSGQVIDQSALCGLLAKMHHQGLQLISVQSEVQEDCHQQLDD